MTENNEVGRAWKAGKAAHSQNLSTNGKDIYSYALRIGYTQAGKKIAIDYTRTGGHAYSMTTSHHVGIAKRNADKVVAPPK